MMESVETKRTVHTEYESRFLAIVADDFKNNEACKRFMKAGGPTTLSRIIRFDHGVYNIRM